ncbi:MAG: enoyl-CoA hydratase/isomerase family protein [Elusimicrobia bacterium]|nr:enoyl-CoA hydratase/isomerase family protein [Elusimicrobiota bacterium]
MTTASASQQELLIEKKDSALWLTLNRPETLNSLTHGMLKNLFKALKNAANDTSIRSIVLTGSGRGFCAGADLVEFMGNVASKGEAMSFQKELDEFFHPIAQAIKEAPQIVIARLNGTCAGAGSSIALHCDIKLATTDTNFYAAFAKIGLAPDTGASYLLTQALGYSKALEFFIFRGKATAAEFESYGLINKIFESTGVLDQALNSWIKQIEELPRQAVTLTKRDLRLASGSKDLEDAMAYEARVQEFLGHTPNHIEGTRAFFEKRTPRFF